MLAFVKTRLRRRWLAVLLPWLVLLPLGVAGRTLRAAPASVFTVNAVVDASDAVVGDGQCETVPGNGLCTLRAAVQEASANPNPDTIHLPAGAFSLSRAGNDDSGLNGDLDLTGTLTLVGAGPASTVIDATAMPDRVFDVHAGAVTIDGVAIQGGLAEGYGGGVLNRTDASLTLSETLITRNRVQGFSAQGGGIFNSGQLTLTHSLVVSNLITSTAVPQGGGIALSYAPSSTLLIAHSTISGNVAVGGYGGGLYIALRPVTITHSTISHNQGQRGGGIYAASDTVWIVNSTLSANRAEQDGGGLINTTSGSVYFYNATVAGNWANDGDEGAYGGGIAQIAGHISLINSVLAGNLRTDWSGPFVEASDCSGEILSAGANYVSAADGCTINGVAPLTGGLALLGPLADNGGPVPTHALLPGSPALDAGAEAGCTDPFGQLLTTDQRGQPRPAFGGQATRCDLGAYERQVMVLLPYLQR